MEIRERQVGEVTILDLVGNFTAEDESMDLLDKVESLLGEGKKKLLLNLESVPYMNSVGLHTIVSCYTKASRARGSFKLMNLPQQISNLLKVTKLYEVFTVFKTEEEAVKSFG